MASGKNIYKVLVAGANDKTFALLQTLLPGNSYDPPLRAGSAGEAKRMALDYAVDIAILNAPMRDEFGTQLALNLARDNVGVLLLVPLQPVLESPVLTPAFDNVVPALFGALGLKYFLKGKKFAAIPLVLSSLVCILMPSLIKQTSVLLIVIGGLTIAVAWLFYKKGALNE